MLPISERTDVKIFFGGVSEIIQSKEFTLMEPLEEKEGECRTKTHDDVLCPSVSGPVTAAN